MRKLIATSKFRVEQFIAFSTTKFHKSKLLIQKPAIPVKDVSATIRGTGKGSSSDVAGILKIQANSNDVLDITSIGYKPQSVQLSGSSEISISLEASSVDLGDIVVVGSRGTGRAKTETAVPVDVIKINQVGLPTAKMDPYIDFKCCSTFFQL